MTRAEAERCARELFQTWMKTRPAGVYQSSIMSTEATRLVSMIADALDALPDTGEVDGWRQTLGFGEIVMMSEQRNRPGLPPRWCAHRGERAAGGEAVMQLFTILAMKDLAIRDSVMTRVLSVIPSDQKEAVIAKIDEGIDAANKRWFWEHINAAFGKDADTIRSKIRDADINTADTGEADGWRQGAGAKIIAGLQDAVHVTRLANSILALLPASVVTKDLHSRIIATLAPHVPSPPNPGEG